MRLFKNHLKKLANSLVIFILILCVIVSPGWLNTSVLADDSLSDLRKQQEELEAEKEETDTRLALLKDDITQKREYSEEINQQIETVQQEVENLGKQIDLLNQKIADAENAISDKQASINKNLELLKERIKALYLAGDASSLDIILSSQNFMDYYEKSKILKAVSEHDSQLIALLTEQMDDIQEELESINADKEDLSEKKKIQDSRYAELGELYEEAQRLLMDAVDEEATILANSEILGARLEENEAAIKELEEELRKQYGASGSNLGGSGFTGTGSFLWPMPGYTYITCYFGEGGHRGIDVAGGDIYGKAIVAADSGFVEYAGWNDSYGYCVFINHGNGYETRYAHMSSLGTSTGASVGQGETIGFVGSTGNSTGPHLHYEVIYNGGLTNPFNYYG